MTLFELGVFAGEAMIDYEGWEGSGVIIPSMTSALIRRCVNYARDTWHVTTEVGGK